MVNEDVDSLGVYVKVWVTVGPVSVVLRMTVDSASLVV